MAKRRIMTGDAECLYKVCRKVDNFDKRLAVLLDDMAETMYDAEGVGLAAPQVGVLRRVAVVKVEEGYFEFVNPVITAEKGVQEGWEGCLSVRGKRGIVVRPQKVAVSYFDRYGNPQSLKAKGFFARAICHEFDHLDGILYTDKATYVCAD